jgi:hypothetical protein
MEEYRMLSSQMPSFDSWYDCPQWIYEGVNIISNLERKYEEKKNA